MSRGQAVATLAVLVGLAFAETIAAQPAARSIGRVVDLAGRPVAGAEVVLLSRPIPRDRNAGAADRRTVKTNARGMWQTAIEQDTRYTVWAHWQGAASRFAEGVLAGEFVELREAPGTGPIEVQVDGIELWGGPEALRLRALVGGENLDHVELARLGEAWRLPPLPLSSGATIEILHAAGPFAGEVLWRGSIRRNQQRARFEIPAPREFEIEVTDDKGQPVAGVAMRWHICNYWYTASPALPFGDRFRSLWPVVGRTDAAGKATVRLPVEPSENEVWFLADKAGYTMSLDGFDDGHPFAGGKVDLTKKYEAGTPIKVTLKAFTPFPIVLNADPLAPVAADWLFLNCRVSIEHERGGSGTQFQVVAPIVDGRAQLPSPLPAGTEIEIAEFLLADSMRRRLAQKHGFVPRRVWRVPVPEDLIDKGPSALPDPMASRVLRVVGGNGRPAARAVVRLVDSANKRETTLRTGRLGRVLVPGGREQRVGVLCEQGMGVLAVEAEGADALELVLEPLERLVVEVKDEAGEPVADLPLFVTLQSAVDDEHDFGWFAEKLIGLLPRRVTDAAGRAELAVPSWNCTFQFRLARRIIDGKNCEFEPAATRRGANEPTDPVHRITVGPKR